MNSKYNFRSYWSRNNTKNSSKENHGPSERSRKSILEGSKAFVWKNEVSRTDAPYANHKYDEAFNPPPNEVNYIGGIGKNKSRIRSKLHPNRPTLLQKIYGMTRMNKIDVNLTQPLQQTNNCVVRKKKITDLGPAAITAIVQHISFSDFKDNRSAPPSDTSSSNEFPTSASLARSRSGTAETSVNRNIDGKSFYINQKEVKQKAQHVIDKIIDKTIDISRVVETDRYFKVWAKDERTKFKTKDQPPIRKPPQAESEASSIGSSSPIASLSGRRRRRRRRKRTQNGTTGHMFGPLHNGPIGPDKLTVHSDKFGVPMTMINRVRKAHRKRKIRESVLRKVRFAHMGYIQPPDRDESSDNESMENVKKLALIRTPYFVIPTIKISQVKRKDRFRNKFLRKDRLKRINLLLSDRRNSAERREHFKYSDEVYEDDDLEAMENDAVGMTKKHQFFAKFFQLSTKKKSELKRLPEKEKYYELILNKYEEHRQQCEPQKKSSTQITFDEFKKNEEANGNGSINNHHSANDSPIKISLQTATEKQENRNDVLSKLFRRRKNYRLRNVDDVEGPLYTDPFLVDKLYNPKKFTARSKNYASLFKTRFNIRNRLQVNGPELKDEKIGDENTYFSRLATEWDEYYIHELRHRKPAKKFRVKSDILMIRDIVRKNYCMYYTQENLLDLKVQQNAEVERLEAEDEALKAQLQTFDVMTNEAYGKVVAKNIRLEEFQAVNKSLKIKKEALAEEFDKLTKDVLIIERNWEFLLLIQNYYYLLMRIEWRTENDWIHRDECGNLLPPLVAIVNCAKRNMRDKSYCSGFAVKAHYENEVVPKLDKMKSIIPDAGLLKKCLESLMKKSFTTLIQHNKTLWTFKEISQMHQNLKNDMQTFKSMQERKIEALTKKQTFMAERQQNLKQVGHKLINHGLSAALSSKMEGKIMAISEVLYERFAPHEQIKEQLINDITSMDKFTYIHRYCMELLRKLDEIPVDLLLICEKATRDKRKMDKSLSKRAVIQQNRFEMWTKQIRHQFTPIPDFRRVNILPPFMVKKKSKVGIK